MQNPLESTSPTPTRVINYDLEVLAHAHTDQVDCTLCHHTMQCQHTPIILQWLAIQQKLLPLGRGVAGKGLGLEVLHRIEPRAYRGDGCCQNVAVHRENVDRNTLRKREDVSAL